MTTIYEGVDVETFPKSAASWYLEDANNGYKVLDKSAYKNRGTAIPIKLRSFFINGTMKRGERRAVTLSYNGKRYEAWIQMLTDAGAKNPRTHLLWGTDFMALLAETYPAHYRKAIANLKLSVENSKAILKLTRTSDFTEYEVSFSDKGRI